MRLLGKHGDNEQAPADNGGRSLFHHEVRYAGRPVVVLEGMPTAGGVTVEATVYPVNDAPGAPPTTHPFSFSTAEQARRFTEDALVSLEYLDCTVANETAETRGVRESSQPGTPTFADPD